MEEEIAMKRKTTTKKRNPTDLTLRNLRALKKRVHLLELAIMAQGIVIKRFLSRKGLMKREKEK